VATKLHKLQVQIKAQYTERTVYQLLHYLCYSYLQ